MGFVSIDRILSILILCAASSAFAADEFTLYDLLAPDTHQFAITYDVTQTREGAALFFNPIRPGSIASKERVLARATGADLQFEVVSGKDAKASGLLSDKTADDALFNNAGQHFNHSFYWQCMKPKGGGEPTGKLADAIKKSLGSFQTFFKALNLLNLPLPILEIREAGRSTLNCFDHGFECYL